MAQKGDFIGFTFNGTHSSDLGIVRTSNGSRYNTNLLPSSSDQTVAVPGGDGVYFFGTNYQTRVFQLQIASDEISEETMRRIQQTWGDKEIHELIFDETPYKVYMAKCTNMPQFNFLCFDENNQRVYKGEGSVEFTCYYPYAKSRYKFLDQYGEDEDPHMAVPEWNSDEVVLGDQFFHHHHLLGNPHTSIESSMKDLCNIDEWSAASGMRETIGELDLNNTERESPSDPPTLPSDQVFVFNPGDIEADFQLWFDPVGAIGLSYYISNGSEPVLLRQLNFNFSGETFAANYLIQYDSKTELLTGYINENVADNKLFNKYITTGDFFKIPIIKTLESNPRIILEKTSGNSPLIRKIKYDYLYY